jgi:hypothetical protein
VFLVELDGVQAVVKLAEEFVEQVLFVSQRASLRYPVESASVTLLLIPERIKGMTDLAREPRPPTTAVASGLTSSMRERTVSGQTVMSTCSRVRCADLHSGTA